MNICECTAKITDPVRAARFKGIFENDNIPIKHPFVAGNGQTGDEVYQFYKVAINRFSDEERIQVAQALAPVFNLPVSEILKDMSDPNFEVPLKADSVITVWCKRHSRAVLP